MADNDDEFDEYIRPAADSVAWDIRHEGRAWAGEEAHKRYQLTPEKLEMWEGKLLFEDNERLLLLGLLLENVGVDAAVRLGSPQVWRDAIATLPSDV